MRRLLTATAIAAFACGTAACATPTDRLTSSTDQERASTAPVEAAQVDAQCSGSRVLMPGAVGQSPLTNLAMCGDLQRGRDLGVLGQPKTITWDHRCLADSGWSVTKRPDGSDVLTGPDAAVYDPQSVAHCGTPTYTPEQCTKLQNGMGAVDATSAGRGIVLDYPSASVLNRLGCSVPTPPKQEGVAEAQR